MAKFVQFGKCIDFTPAEAVKAGDIVKIGDDFYGVADHPIDASTLGALTVRGVYAIPAASAITLGAKVYAGENNTVTATAAQGTAVGRALNAAASGATVLVLLNA